MALDPVEKARKTAELLRQTREVWETICKAEPTRRIGGAINENRSFDSLSEDDQIWCARLTVELRRVVAPRVLTAPPEDQEASPEPPAGSNSTPPSLQNSTDDGAQGDAETNGANGAANGAKEVLKPDQIIGADGSVDERQVS